MDTLGERLLTISRDLADAFADVPTPPALAWALDRSTAHRLPYVRYDLGDPRERLAILAGPRALPWSDVLLGVAEHLSAPVANTWGAKGILRWDSPHHMGTCGLQAHDYRLLGLADFDTLLTVGLDPAESSPASYALTRVVDIRFLVSLTHLAGETPPRHHEIRPNALYERIAAVAQPGYVDERTPRHPARAVMDLKRSLGPGAIVAAQPGDVGLWVARTFPTDAPGTVFVPAVDAPGIAAAIALVAADAGRSAVAVVPAPVDPLTQALADAAARSTPFRLEVWGDDVDLSLTSLLVDAAGPVVAWRS